MTYWSLYCQLLHLAPSWRSCAHNSRLLNSPNMLATTLLVGIWAIACDWLVSTLVWLASLDINRKCFSPVHSGQTVMHFGLMWPWEFLALQSWCYSPWHNPASRQIVCNLGLCKKTVKESLNTTAMGTTVTGYPGLVTIHRNDIILKFCTVHGSNTDILCANFEMISQLKMIWA